MNTRVYFSLGSNMGDSPAILGRAVHHLARLGTELAVASLYRTAPQDYLDQDDFWNTVVGLSTALGPHELLSEIRTLEAHEQRVRLIDKGPRTLDVDILLYGDLVIREAGLVIPHERMGMRRFVLEPLLEIAPGICDPRNGAPFALLLPALGDQGIYAQHPLAYNGALSWNQAIWSPSPQMIRQNP